MNYQQLFCDNVIKEGSSGYLTASGYSMWPVIPDGTRAEISPLGSSFPKKGDLLLINRDGRLTVHRCWKIVCHNGNPLVITKGDTNLGFDPPTPLNQVLGRVVKLRFRVFGDMNPNRGLLKLYSEVICLGEPLARYWARICRFLLRRTKRV